MKVALAGIASVAVFATAGHAASDPINDVLRRELARFVVKATSLQRENKTLRRRNRKLQRHLYAYGRWVRSLQRTLRYDPEVSEAIDLSAVTYHVSDATLWRKARCESHLYARAKNRHSTASGLFQFLTSTWSSTPYRGFSIWSPYANAMAAGWMHANGRGGEWACR